MRSLKGSTATGRTDLPMPSAEPPMAPSLATGGNRRGSVKAAATALVKMQALKRAAGGERTNEPVDAAKRASAGRGIHGEPSTGCGDDMLEVSQEQIRSNRLTI